MRIGWQHLEAFVFEQIYDLISLYQKGILSIIISHSRHAGIIHPSCLCAQSQDFRRPTRQSTQLHEQRRYDMQYMFWGVADLSGFDLASRFPVVPAP